MLVIFHDNGIKGLEGSTEYSIGELEKKGGLNALLTEYEKAGITVLRWFFA